MTCAYTEGRPRWAGPPSCSRGDATDYVRFATLCDGDRADAPYVVFTPDHHGATMPSRRQHHPKDPGNENNPAGGRGCLVVLHMGREEEGRGSEVPAHKITDPTAALEPPATPNP